MIIVFSIFHYQTGNFILAFKHYVSSRSVEKLSCCTCLLFLLSLAFGNSRIYCKWSYYQIQNQFSTETDWDLGQVKERRPNRMEIKIASEKLNNEAAQITLPGRNSANGSCLTKKINPRRCADLHNWYGWKMDMGRTELSTHKKSRGRIRFVLGDE